MNEDPYFYQEVKPHSLDAIGLRHGTDKASSFHGYLSTYEHYFAPMRQKPINLLEIGVAGGASMAMWKEYFTDEGTEIRGLDHNEEFVKAARELFPPAKAPGMFFAWGDVKDDVVWFELKSTGIEFDIVIDDGGHYSDQIIAAFKGAWPLLKSGGIYAVEDLHQIFVQEYDHGAQTTAFEYFHRIMLDQLHERGFKQCGKPEIGDIAFMHWHKSLLIIGKR